VNQVKHLVWALILVPFLSLGQKVYVTDKRNKADLVVYRVKYFCEAHLVISRTWEWDSKEKYHWYFVDSAHSADPGWVIYYTNKREDADTCVYFTNRKALLGSYYPVKTPVEVDVDKKRGNGY
jgi:hypothetical protein